MNTTNTNKRTRINKHELIKQINFFLAQTDQQTVEIIKTYVGGWIHFIPPQLKQIKSNSELELITLVRLYNALIKMQPQP
jgi:hypothetical protein